MTETQNQRPLPERPATEPPRVIAVIFAGGTGSRMRGADKPKQFLELGGRSIIAHTLQHFENHPRVVAIFIACLENWIPYLHNEVAYFGFEKVKAIVPGGPTCQLSIAQGLEAAHEWLNLMTSPCGKSAPSISDASAGSGTGDEPQSVSELVTVRDLDPFALPASGAIALVHDGVRPLIDNQTISRCIASVERYGSAITVAPAIETIIVSEGTRVGQVMDRSRCKLARAPQAFWLDELLAAHRRAQAEGRDDFIDCLTLMTHYGYEAHTVEGPPDNIKITTRRDFFAFKGYVDYKEMEQLWEA